MRDSALLNIEMRGRIGDGGGKAGSGCESRAIWVTFAHSCIPSPINVKGIGSKVEGIRHIFKFFISF